MTRVTTLSLITIAILGLNGCGEPSKSAGGSEEVTSITKLSQASQKHSKAEWDKLENEIQALDNTKDFDTMLLGSTEKNVASLTTVGIDKEMSYAMNSDLMFDDLTNLDLEDLDNQVTLECTDNETCKEEAYASLNVEFDIDKEEAYAMSVMYREDIIKKPSTMDGLLKEFTCATGLVRKVQFYGVEDNFSTANGDENATASQQIQNNPNMIAYNNNVNAGFANYDGSTQNRLFGEEVKNLPSGIANGHFYIGLQNHGSNDRLTLGNIDTNSTTEDYFGATITSNNASLLKDGSVYHEALSNIDLVDGSTLKQYAYNHQGFDVYVQDDTFVDFIAVATCSKPNPIKEIKKIVNNFECSEKETMLKILGGEIDAFAPTGDANNPANPSTALVASSNYYRTSDYDQTNVNKALLDTLDLSQVSGAVTKAEFHIGYKSLGNPLTGNDTVYIGEHAVEHIGGRYLLYPNGTNINTPTPWVPHTVSGGEKLLSVNLENTTSNFTPSLNMLDWIQGKSAFDIRVEDDTAVDFTQLNLCVQNNCSESAENIELNLSKLASWTFKPSDATENNVFNGTQYEGVWDNTLNWFDFENSHSDEVLEIPFCACSNTIVNINNLKADNSATIKLDGSLVASQQGNDQESMKRDDMGGNHVDGSLTLPAGTNGGTNHVLRVDVHNLGSEFGVAIDGTLTFKGNLGKCTTAQ